MTPLALIEIALNRAIRMDSEMPLRLAAFDGKVVGCELTQPPLRAFLAFQDGRVQLLGQHEAPDATLRGGATQWLALARRQADVGLQLAGDTELAQQLIDVIRGFRFDWEEALSQGIGDMPAQRLSELVRGSREQTRGAMQSLFGHLAEYLQYERPGATPGAPESEAELREELSAVNQRLAHLEAQLEALLKQQRT